MDSLTGVCLPFFAFVRTGKIDMEPSVYNNYTAWLLNRDHEIESHPVALFLP